VVAIKYDFFVVYIRLIGTHAEYETGAREGASPE
jgi:mRNA-degrading endonuclease HigB of HigAB toxin-antitoxin module